MKKFKFFIVTVLTMFGVVENVNAVSDSTELINCVNGTEDICKISADFSLVSPITISGDRVVTIDLNNHNIELKNTIVLNGNGKLTVTGSGEINTDSIDYMFDVYPGATLVLENGKFTNLSNGGKIIGVTGSKTDSESLPKAKAIIKEAAVLKANYGIVIRHAGSKASYGATVDFAGTIEAISDNNGYVNGSVGIFVNGNIQKSSGNIPEINITGGTITTTEGKTGNPSNDSAPALSASGYAKWNISDGNITGTEAIAIKAGEFNISGGLLNATGKYYDPASGNFNGSEATGAAISITATKNYSNNVKLNISGATITSKHGNALYEGISADKDGNKTTTASSLVENGLEITGGKFITEDSTKDALDIEKDIKEFISGGEFSSTVIEEYLAKNLESSKQDDGSYLVGTRYNITIQSNGGGKVGTDKVTAINGESVTITIKADEGYNLKSVKVNDNEVKDNKFIMPNGDAEIKVEFEKVVVEEENKTESTIQESTKDEVKVESPEESAVVPESENPKTGDNLFGYGLLILISILGYKISLRRKHN